MPLQKFLFTWSIFILFSSGLFASMDGNIDQDLEGAKITCLLKKQLSLCYYADDKHGDEFKIQTTHFSSSKSRFFLSDSPQNQELFIKVSLGKQEFIRLTTVQKYMKSINSDVAPLLCLPIRADYVDPYSIFVFSKINGVSIDEIISQYKLGKISEAEACRIYRLFGEAVARMHGLGELKIVGQGLESRCLHEDLNADNVFFSSAKGIQFIDLGTMYLSLTYSYQREVKSEFTWLYARCFPTIFNSPFHPKPPLLAAFLSGYSIGSGLNQIEINSILYLLTMNHLASPMVTERFSQEELSVLISELDDCLKQELKLTDYAQWLRYKKTTNV